MDNDFTPAPGQQSLGVQPIQPEPQLAQPIAQPAAHPAMPTIQPEPQPVAQPIVSSSQPEPQPVAQPIVSAESQVQTPTPMQSESQPKPKSKHIGRLVAIIASVVVLLAGAGFAIYYFLILPKDPNYVASRMITQLGNNFSAGATVSVSSSVKVSQSTGLGEVESDSLEIELGLDGIATSDQHVYIKPSGISSILSLVSGTIDTDSVVGSGYVDFLEALTKIDNHWIKFNLGEDYQQFGLAVDFDCLNGLSTTANKQLSDLYQKYPFVTLVTSEDSFYQLTLKQDTLANFLVEYINAASKQELGQCFASGDFKPFEGLDDITVDDINLDSLESLPALYVALDNNYNLTELKFSLDEGGIAAAVHFGFTYGAEADKLIPTDAYTLEDLWSILITDVQSSQRDTQRRNDVVRVQTQIVNYQTNNRGLLPDNWDVFRNNYLTAFGDAFTDPDGTDYILSASNVPIAVPEVLNHTIYITTGAACGGDGEAVANQPDAYAVQYRLENGTLYCVSNL